VTAVVSLAAGIASTAAIFSIADALLLRPRAGIVHPGMLVDVGRSTNGQGMDNIGYPLFETMRSETRLLAAMAAHRLSPEVMSLGDASASERVFAGLVSANYFETLGTRPALGRFFLPEEEATGDTHPVVVLSHGFWMRRFDSRADLVGQTLRLNNRQYTVVGVAEPGFTGTTFIAADMWIPMAMDKHVRASDRSLRGDHLSVWMMAIGRLKPDVTGAEARDELHAIMHNYLRSRGDSRVERWGAAVATSARVPAPMAGPVTGFVAMLGTLTGLVLLIACSNVAGMLLARGLERRRELATRLAVGASRLTLIRQLLLEGLTLALVAGAVSLPLTYAIVGLLASSLPSLPIPLAVDLRVDARVHGIAFLLSALAAVAFSLVPALQTSRVNVASALHGANATPDRRRAWLRQGLVTAQVAVALLLLVAAGLFLRSLQEAVTTDIGFDVDSVDTLQIDTAIAGYAATPEAIRAVETLIQRFALIDGVSAVAASRMVPLQGGGMGLGGLRAAGYTGPDGRGSVDADWDVISPDYFKTLRLGLAEGRPFGGQDRLGAPFVAIINETMAKLLWPGQSAVGQTLSQELGQGEKHTLTVVGVARNAKYRSVGDRPRNFIYVPLAQQFRSEMTFYVRRAPGQSRVAELRRTVVAFNPMLPVIHTSTLAADTAIGLLPQRLAAWIASSVASLGLFLAAIGLYGLMAFTVSQRQREIAIRLAIGAPQAAVVRLVLRQAAALAAAGSIVGLTLAAGVATLLRTFLVGLEPIDPLAFGIAFGLLVMVMLLACWAPARRATRLDPVRLLRAE
jgi:predicted permease